MTVLYVGEMGDAVNNVIALSRIAKKVIVLNTSLTHFYDDVPGMKETTGESCRVYNLYNANGLVARRVPVKLWKIFRYLSSFFGVGILRPLVRRFDTYVSIQNMVREESVEVVFAAWGIGVIPDVLFLHAVDQRLPIVHYLPTFPTSEISWLREQIEIILFRRVAHLVKGVVVGSAKMKDFLVKKYRFDHASIFIGPIFYVSEYFKKDMLPSLSESDAEMHLVFTGTTDFSKKYNDVKDQLMQISERKIHVHCIRIENMVVPNSYLHFFERFSTFDMLNGALATFMTQFDGCLVLYNGDSRRLRYELSVPQRFLFCFTAGIPIFMPKGVFASCEDIVESKENGFVYNSYKELSAVLRDPKLMLTLKKNARLIGNNFTFEAQAKELSSFISGLLPN